MTNLPPSSLAQAIDIHSRFAVELAFVVPGEKTGLLPINSFFMDLEDLLNKDVPEPVSKSIAAGRDWINETFDGPGTFSEKTIKLLNEWHGWFGEALSAWDQGKPLPAHPEAWTSGEVIPVAEVATSTPAPEVAEEPVITQEKAIVLNLKDDAELLNEFHGESVELLQNIEQGLLVLEDNPGDSGTINSIFRAFHTFKGAAGFLRLLALQDLAHDLESLLDAARQSKIRITTPIIDIILAGSDALKNYTFQIGLQLKGTNAGKPIVVPTSELILRVRAALRGELPPEPTPPQPIAAPEPTSVEPPKKETSAPQVQATEKALEVIPPKETPATSIAVNVTHLNPTPTTSKEPTEIKDQSSGFVKLDTSKLDALIDLVGELVIAQSMVVQDPDVQSLESRTLARSLRQLSRTTSELQRNAMSLRMVPVRAAFQKMTRLVRDIGAHQKKQVQLVLDGEETELDRNIVEKLADPLVHMIRNAVDHGIEAPADRIANGKPALGTIKLSASHQRGGILIRIQDDGKGLNADKILAKGIERGLVAPNAELTESEIYNLIFMPGFSTAETITDLSGRGVGMDVVKRNIEGLRGKVEIQSVLGKGSTFNILLPLTLAIIDGLLVGVGNDRYIIPTISVRESFRPKPGMVTTIHERGAMVSVRGKQTPVLRLGQFLGTTGVKATTDEEGIIIVVESGDAMRGILVDELIGKQEVVIKSLGETFKDQNLLAGAAVLGDGAVGLILDVDTLVKL
ncbi:MAG: chemotaxis protein CheA [Verrucomicrobia bacterium]|nr:chemotaxis protein CheA [Verrucomicrobiota bacterium]